jgi:hypothetical protein
VENKGMGAKRKKVSQIAPLSLIMGKLFENKESILNYTF